MSKPSPVQNSSVDTICAAGIIRASVVFPAPPRPPIPTRTRPAPVSAAAMQIEYRPYVHRRTVPSPHGEAAARRHGSLERGARARPDLVGCGGARLRRIHPLRLRREAAASPRTSRPRSSEGHCVWQRRSPCSPTCAGRCRRHASRSSGRASRPRSSAAPPQPAIARRSGLGLAAREAIVAFASLAPAAVALRGGELASYHGAEHISIGTYETGEPATKEHDRCGGHLVGPLLLTSAAASALATRAPARARPTARAVGAVGALGAAVEIFGWMDRHPDHPLARALARPGHELQARVSTAEPSAAQLEVAEAALAACLAAEEAV